MALINAYAHAMVSPLVANGWPADADARRGIATRLLIAEDARLVQDAALSAAKGADGGSYTALLLSHHFVRIAYEGAIALRSGNKMVGMPALAELLTDQFAAITERARHMSKLLDDRKKSEDEVLAEIEDALSRMRSTFLETGSGFARLLATDLGLYRIEDRVIGATVAMAYRLGLDGVGPNMFNQGIGDVTQEWGSAVAVLAAADLRVIKHKATLKLDVSTISAQDVRSTKYLAGRYDPEIDESAKVLLLMVESDLNCNRLYLPQFAVGHEGAVFRARVVTLYHSLKAVAAIADAYPTVDTQAMREVRTILSDVPTKRILSQPGKWVRNRCVHYEIGDKKVEIRPELPFYGIVEAVFPGETFESFDRDVKDVTERLAEVLSGWAR